MSESNASSAMIKRLEEEGEVGADYLEDLLDIVDLGGDIDNYYCAQGHRKRYWRPLPRNQKAFPVKPQIHFLSIL